jgi:hypothetical protein
VRANTLIDSGVVGRAACACGTKPRRGAWHVIQAATDHVHVTYARAHALV